MIKTIKAAVVIAILTAISWFVFTGINGRVIDQFSYDNVNVTVRELSPCVYRLDYKMIEDTKDNMAYMGNGVKCPIIGYDFNAECQATIVAVEGYESIKESVRSNNIDTVIE